MGATRLIIIIFCFLAGAACSRQPTTVLDAANPIHCMAAFNVIAVVGKQAENVKLQQESITRALFESEKLENRYSSDDAKAETMEVGQDLSRDLDATQSLAVDCAKKQDADPSFTARVPDLLIRSREWNPST